MKHKRLAWIPRLDKRTLTRAASALLLIIGLYTSFSLVAESAHADPFTDGQFETKMSMLQKKFINIILPAASILGLVVAGIMAASGNEGAKAKMYVVLVGSIIGFLAPHIIGWIKAILG